MGSCAAAGFARRKEWGAVQLSGGIPKGALPLGRAFGSFSRVRKGTRLSGRDPTKGRICRNPPAKGGSAPKRERKREKEREEARLWLPPITICIWTPGGT